MFNLVKYRWLFILISMVIIVPGTLSLIIAHLNVGIDFRSGANIELRPQRSVTIAEMNQYVKPLKFTDLQFVLGDVGTTSTSQAGNKIVWVRLNTAIDTTVQNDIYNGSNANNPTGLVPTKYPGAKVRIDIIPGSKPYTLLTITGFTSTPTISDIQTLFSKLPNTSDPSKGPATVSTTPVATGTPTKGTTITTSPTPTSSNPSNIPVNVTDISQGTSTQTVIIQTTSQFQTSDVPSLFSAILSQGGPYMFLNSNSEVSPSVASQTTTNAILAVIAASVLILGYIWFSFRKVAKPWRYGACAIIALLHDVLVVLGIFSILGWSPLHIQVDSLFITALLTVVGFSVHDTIVVFDRIRENMQRRTVETFEQVVNASLIQTMARSLNTSLTVIFTLSALTLFGGSGSVHNFTLALLIGIISGTYSSIFNASMLLVIWDKGEFNLNTFLHRNDTPTISKREERELARARG